MNMFSRASASFPYHPNNTIRLLSEEKLFIELQEVTTVDEMQDFLLQGIQQLMEFHKQTDHKNNSKIINLAVKYIEENLTEPDLSLKKVAASIFTNESYLSRTFKIEMGESMIQYITKKRIAESIRLLRTTNLKAYEIAEKVGFRDSHYFSICFKKQVGVTVKEFKKNES